MSNPRPCAGSGREAATLEPHGGRARCPDCHNDVRVLTDGRWPVLADHNGDGVAYPGRDGAATIRGRERRDWMLNAAAARQAEEAADQLDRAATALERMRMGGGPFPLAVTLLRDRATALRQAAADRGRTV